MEKNENSHKNGVVYYKPERGGVFFLEANGKAKTNMSSLILIISNELHNQFSDHLIVTLITDKKTEKVRESLEVYCELEVGTERMKLKILASHLYTVSKENFFKMEHYLGKVDEKTMRKVTEKIRMILDLDS